MKRLKSPWLWFGILGLITVALVVWLNNRFPGSLSNRDNQIDLTRSLLVLAFVGASVFVHRREKLSHVIRNLGLWCAIAGVLFIGYSFRDEAKWLGGKLYAELVPVSGETNAGSIRFAKSSNGHFQVEILVDGIPVQFLVDTGATDIILSPGDAIRLGFDTSALRYSKIYNTANGSVHAAPVELGVMTLGPISLRDTRASVNSAKMSKSLLGMSFLNRLSGYEVSGDHLVLHP
jgi:aspartyl protease family protein